MKQQPQPLIHMKHAIKEPKYNKDLQWLVATLKKVYSLFSFKMHCINESDNKFILNQIKNVLTYLHWDSKVALIQIFGNSKHALM